ncbi:MAG: hypothetical protein GFH27_549291n73 [Chloroflexi bacterium AL-W]|nr:hypothetical protein [Chloroflexi bacterium AL-N1]NOK67460.1 hypothetical protein [Chloroflexi bacterium AL-N10]NOK75048.1 hypothetical protein [Chloroflexi bacterium AL-N5]NOK81835.1 hypothetical protein [Chloroflexi bacterium AL-W]NOK89681.1 hypothetical protein [Chloroflexi bacterium AL-N15]
MTQNPQDKNQQIATLRDKIAELEVVCNDEAQLPVVRDIIRNELEKTQQELAKLIGSDSEQPSSKDAVTTNQGTVTSNSSDLQGTVAGVISQSTIYQFFNGKPPEDGERLLQLYLNQLINQYDTVLLRRMTEKRQSGTEQATTPKLKLQDVYTSLTTNGADIVVEEQVGTVDVLEEWYEQQDYQATSPDTHDPLHVRRWQLYAPSSPLANPSSYQDTAWIAIPKDSDSNNPDEVLKLRGYRPELALDAIQQHKKLVLLGEPGSGKSTVLRYLAVLLAQQLLSMPTAIPGWEKVESLPIPILCPLGEVARALTKTGDADQALWQTLEQTIDGIHRLRDGLLKDAMKRGAVLLLCDGLDELPETSTSNSQIKPRRDIARALRRLAREIPDLCMVLTSRVKPYHESSDWQMPSEENWETRTIQDLAPGQVQTFIRSWYRALAGETGPLSEELATTRSDQLISQIDASYTRLEPLVKSPLLLTIMVILHDNSKNGVIPDERVLLYDECVKLLLERWEPVRNSDEPEERRRLLARLGNIPGLSLDLLRDVLHELAFHAHNQPQDNDGRGMIAGEKLNWEITKFFKGLGCANPVEKLDIFREVLETDAGLLQTPNHNCYAFPHRTFQEYLAACYLAEQADANEPDMCTLAYERWSDAPGQWRETLLLMIAQLRKIQPQKVYYNGLPWLKQLIEPQLHGQRKPTQQHQRDILLATLSYNETGIRETLGVKSKESQQTFEKKLRKSICQVLHKPCQDIGLADRIAMAQILGQLGDPRFPTTLKEWRRETFRTTFGKPKVYWCYIPAGTYRIDGWAEDEEEDTPAADITLPKYWIARFPITVAQFRPFVEVGYSDEAQRWWTPQGWQWKNERKRTEPWEWGSARWGGPNQPVIGVTWYEAMAFVNWRTEQLVDTLPEGYRLRLPTEAEWEVAAAYDGAGNRRHYPWGEAAPTWEHAVYNKSVLQQTAPVGCCAKGQAACGALDMAGNVWEWTASQFASYPQESHQVVEDLEANNPVAIRGGAWVGQAEHLFCGARNQNLPVNLGRGNPGLRVVVSLRIVH